MFYDFSSGIGGNVLTFIQKYNKCSFVKAVDILKRYANITEEYVDHKLSAVKTMKKYKSSILKPIEPHKILSEDVMLQYDSDCEKLKIWEREGISTEVLTKYQVRYDPFSNRLVFPIRDLYGNIISVKGRTLDKNYKEKKLRKYTYFQSIGNIDLLFGYYEHVEYIKNKKEIIIFEGEKSVMLMESWGYFNAAAILTSHLNPLQLPILIKLGVRIVFALDKDINIYEDENIKKLSHFVRVEYVRDTENLLEPKMSPVDAGEDTWLHLYERRIPI